MQHSIEGRARNVSKLLLVALALTALGFALAFFARSSPHGLVARIGVGLVIAGVAMGLVLAPIGVVLNLRTTYRRIRIASGSSDLDSDNDPTKRKRGEA